MPWRDGASKLSLGACGAAVCVCIHSERMGRGDPAGSSSRHELHCICHNITIRQIVVINENCERMESTHLALLVVCINTVRSLRGGLGAEAPLLQIRAAGER